MDSVAPWRCRSTLRGHVSGEAMANLLSREMTVRACDTKRVYAVNKKRIANGVHLINMN